MIKRFACLFAVLALSGCATVTYTYDDQKYDSAEKFFTAIDSNISRVLATITPLPEPLTSKKLLIAFPSAAAFTEVDAKAFVVREGKQPTDAQREVGMTVNRGSVLDIKVFYDAVRKKNIYSSTEYVEMESTVGSYEASEKSDVMYLVVPKAGANQWYYVSQKHGKQIFSYDRSSGKSEGNVQAFVEAVQAQAIRD